MKPKLLPNRFLREKQIFFSTQTKKKQKTPKKSKGKRKSALQPVYLPYLESGYLSVRDSLVKFCSCLMELFIVYGQSALVIYHSTSGHQGQLCFPSQEPELNMERQHLVFMAHISGANPKRGAKSVTSFTSTKFA